MSKTCRPTDRHLVQLKDATQAVVITTPLSLEVNLMLITCICNLINIDSLVNVENISAGGP